MIRHTEPTENKTLSLARLFSTEPSDEASEVQDAARGERFSAALMDFSGLDAAAIVGSAAGSELTTTATAVSEDADQADGESLAELVALLQNQANAAGKADASAQQAIADGSPSGSTSDVSDGTLATDPATVAFVVPLPSVAQTALPVSTPTGSGDTRIGVAAAVAQADVSLGTDPDVLETEQQLSAQTSKAPLDPARAAAKRSDDLGAVQSRDAQTVTKGNTASMTATAGGIAIAAPGDTAGSGRGSSENPRQSKPDPRIQMASRASVFYGMDPAFQSLKDMMMTATSLGEGALSAKGAAVGQVTNVASFPTWAEAASGVTASQTVPEASSEPGRAEIAPSLVISTDGTDWEAEMIDGIMSQITADGSVIDIALTPETLGHVEVRVEMRDGLAEVSFRTETREAARLFAQSEARLADLLNQNGLGLGSQDTSSRQDRRDQQPAAPRHTIDADQVSDLTTLRTGANGTGQLDLIA